MRKYEKKKLDLRCILGHREEDETKTPFFADNTRIIPGSADFQSVPGRGFEGDRRASLSGSLEPSGTSTDR
jgi:hypothetical protein